MIKELIIYGSACFSGFYLCNYLSNKLNFYKGNSNKIDDKNNYKKQLNYKESDLNQISEEMKQIISCPISLTFFKYPSISPYGITIENETIIRALKNNPFCPFTKQPLNINDMRPNLNLYLLIQFLVNKEKYNKNHPNDKILIKEIL